MESPAEQFAMFTGASPSEAEGYLEASGGDLEMAVQLYFGAMGGGGASPTGGGAPPTADFGGAPLPDWYRVIWADMREIPPAWLEQRLDWVRPEELRPALGKAELAFTKFGIVQPRNGPCGVLAAIQAVLIAGCYGKADFGPEYGPSSGDLAQAIATIIAAGAGAGADGAPPQCQVATWRKAEAGAAAVGSPASVDVTSVPTGVELCSFVAEHLADFVAPGGLLLIVYSAVITHGPDAVSAELRSAGGQPPLIFGPFSLCTSELMSLLLRGTADGNVGAYGPVGGAKVDWPASTPCGMLSNLEVEHGIPVCDRLKSPASPVWILHGRDHFTVAFMYPSVTLEAGEESEEDAQAMPEAKTFTMWQWNGLPPNGPRMAKVQVTARYSAPPAPADHKQGVRVFHTPVPGQIYDIVQALPEHKKERPRQWSTWSYEVVLAVPDESGALYGKGEPYKAGCGPKIFEQGSITPGPWRCATCYVKRHETFAFKLNDDGAELCQHCGRKRADVGWSIWMDYESLPKGWQGSMDRRYQPDIATLLSTKWPGAKVEYDDEASPPSV